MHPADLPRSSWSQVYNTGPTRPPLQNGLSWMDPTYPTIDPRTLEENLGNPIVSDKPGPAALDDLFLSERCQKDRQFGMKTYEAASMARLEAYYANQDSASDNPDGDALVVDESQWLKIWRRERWCVDFRQEPQTTGLPTFIWSANDLLVWQELRKCIQLADNILRMGAKDIWLQQLLSADGLEAVKVKIPHGSENEETIWRFKANQHYYPATTEGVLQHLNDPHFYCNVYWLFRDAFWHVISTKSQTEVGTAISYPHGQRLVMPITLDVLFLRTLMDPTATPFAKKTALCLQAITIVHEVMHHVNTDLQKRGALLEPPLLIEPPSRASRETYGKTEPLSEMGHSFERATTGGTIWGLESSIGPDARQAAGGASLLTCLWRFPNLDSGSWQNTYGIPRPAVFEALQWPVPAVWLSSVTSQGFWTRTIGVYGPSAFRMPKAIMSTSDDVGQESSWARNPSEWFWIDGFMPPSYHASALSDMALRLNASYHRHKTHRPWYADSYAMWQMTPWSYHGLRESLYQATDIHFLRRCRRDQERIERIIGQLLHPISLDAQDTENPSADIFVPGCLPNFIAERSTTAWFFRAIGFLMAAALPARHHEGTYQYAEPKCREGLGIPWSIRQNLHMSRVEHDDLQYVIGQLCRSRWVYPQFKLGERHTAPTAQGVLDRRLQLIRFARDAYGIFELFCEHPRGLWTAFDQACHEMEIHLHLDMMNDYESWIPFPFRMPEYPGVWEDGTASDLFQFGASAWEGWSFVRPLAGHHNTFVGERFMAEEVPSPDFFPPCPAWAMSGVAGAPIPVRTFTIADMYDEWKRLGKALLIVPGIDMDIYECDYVCKTLNITTERQWMESVETSWYGLQLNSLAAARFRASDPATMPLGRAVRIMRPDEIFSCNGENGNPLGIRIRNSIYDITSLTCSDMKLLRLLKSAPGRDPSKNVMTEGYEITEVVAGLKPYRVGMVYPTLCKAANKHSLKVFTERTLRRHEFKETGMYVAIFGKVYDITDYAEFHPGGLKFLEENAGRNITELFVQHHSRNLDRVMEYLPELHIGRMVEERTEVVQDQTIDQLHGAHITFNHDEIKFFETVYSVTALQESGEDPELVQKLRPYLGTDATADLQDEDADGGPLMCFARMRAYIVATTRMPDIQLPEMSTSDLAKFDGIVNEREKWRNDAYVAVEDLVYDVTEVIQYGSTYEKYANLGQYLGQKVNDETLATYLKNNCGHRVVARIVSSRIPCPFDPRRALPVRADITAWKARPKRKKPESAPKNPAPKRNDIAPYPQTVDDLKKKRKAKKTGKGHTLSPTPSISKLDYLVQSLSRTAQINGEPQVSNNYEGTRRWVEAQRIKTTRVREGTTVKLPAINPNAPAVVHLSTCTGAHGSKTEGGDIRRADADDLVPLELRSGGNPVRFTLRNAG